MLKTSYFKNFNHPISNSIINQAIKGNIVNFSVSQNNKIEQKNILALIITISNKKELPNYLQSLKDKKIFNDLEYWIKNTSKEYIEELDFKSYGIPYFLFIKNKENIKLIKKHNIDIDNKRSIYPPLIFSLLVNRSIDKEKVDYFLKEAQPDLKNIMADNGNCIDLLGMFPNRNTNDLINIIHKYIFMKPNFPIDFYKNIFFSQNFSGIEKLKESNLDYQKELGKQEMALLLQNIITKQDNEEEVVKFLINNLTTIDLDFETRKKIAEFKPQLFPIIIENQDKLNLKFEHFKDLMFYLDCNINLDNGEQTNPHYKKNITKSLQIIKSYTQLKEIEKNKLNNQKNDIIKRKIL